MQHEIYHAFYMSDELRSFLVCACTGTCKSSFSTPHLRYKMYMNNI